MRRRLSERTVGSDVSVYDEALFIIFFGLFLLLYKKIHFYVRVEVKFRLNRFTISRFDAAYDISETNRRYLY